ncbi:MAG: GDSL-type esterase/lipase family protein [Ruminococcus sp.]
MAAFEIIFDKGEINYNMKKIISLIISFIISITTIYCVSAETNNNFLVLGDSIASGYGLSSSNDSYANLIAKNKNYSLYNNAVSGYTTTDLYNQLFKNNTAISNVANAKLISVSIGGNDFLKDKTNIIQALVNDGINSTYIKAVVNQMENNLRRIIERIHQLNPNSIILLQTIYNPAEIKPTYFQNYSSYFLELYPYINNVFFNVSYEYQYTYVTDVFTAFKSDFSLNCNTDIIQEDGIHPSALGHKIISDAIIDTINVLEKQGIFQKNYDYVIGDVDKDKAVTIKDATIVAKYICHLSILDADARLCADMNNDGMINIKDVTAIQKFLLG